MHVEEYVNDTPLVMEIDTGASLSLLSYCTWQEFFPELMPRKTDVVLKTYTGEQMDLEVEIDVDVRYREQQRKLPLVMVAGSGPALLGRDWLQQIQILWIPWNL